MKNRLVLMGIAFTLLSVPCYALDLRVSVKDVKSNDGMIGCGLHSEASTFPMNPKNESSVKQIWIAAKQSGVECVFENIQPGTYAVAVAHDLNGNKTTDTNFVGMPTEDWGVSNNVRPSFRAPTFDEGKIQVKESQTIEVRISQ
jgi:uncharacterized protein (DUF2141 family)